ncbi:helix-turn-helix domain-containing protein [Cedecea davisae]|uniref:Helix-turn-helix domain-containing protein n=1 Tax=Cedecea davisae TaxID=158484 RepID=A0ABS6DJN2_9ENTR|nr:helix-turn-helix domain-containing protein [Cedecea davisae]MBU4686754.1 helix-turn-helix domain-containing protein [Cedecea davisae]
MSTKLMSYVWDGCAATGMKLSSVAIMARLADFSNDEGVCWPSVETIARQLGGGPSTIRTAIAKLEKDGWLTRTSRRKGNRNDSNIYRLNVSKLQVAALSQLSVSDASESDASNSDASKFDPSKSSKKTSFDPSESGGDPSVNSKQDPSDKKTIGQPQAADPQQDDSLKIDYDQMLETLHSTLPELPKVLKITDKRRKAVRKLWKEYNLTQEKWGAYLRYISKNCRWMLEDRPDTNTGRTWRKKDFDYLVTEECYLSVKELRANDLPKVTRADNTTRDAAFISLVAQARKPVNRVEEIAKSAAGKAGLGRMNEVMARSAWKSIWAQAVEQASEEDLARIPA